MSIISLTNNSFFSNFSFHSKTFFAANGLRKSPLIMKSFPASILFAIAISPSRERSSTPPISLRYILIGSSLLSTSLLFSNSGEAETLFLIRRKSDFFPTRQTLLSKTCKNAFSILFWL